MHWLLCFNCDISHTSLFLKQLRRLKCQHHEDMVSNILSMSSALFSKKLSWNHSVCIWSAVHYLCEMPGNFLKRKVRKLCAAVFLPNLKLVLLFFFFNSFSVACLKRIYAPLPPIGSYIKCNLNWEIVNIGICFFWGWEWGLLLEQELHLILAFFFVL
jgi:hypothetical protein